MYLKFLLYYFIFVKQDLPSPQLPFIEVALLIQFEWKTAKIVFCLLFCLHTCCCFLFISYYQYSVVPIGFFVYIPFKIMKTYKNYCHICVSLEIYIHIYIYIYMYLYMYIYIYIYTYTVSPMDRYITSTISDLMILHFSTGKSL